MIFAPTPKKIRVMLTTFSYGLQNTLNDKVRCADLLPALQAAAAMGIRHFEFGIAGHEMSSRYASEDPFVCMERMREAVGPGADLQILTRSVSGVALTPQPLKALEMQARLMKQHGATSARNVDFMNDIDNLVKTGKPIVEAGMHHQACVALMGLPYPSNRVHTPEFYVRTVQKLLNSGVHVHSVCMMDASGTTTPHTCYETAKSLRKILPPEVTLSMHTSDMASTAVACYMAGIAGGVDSIDLSVQPLASGALQPDVRAMEHALKGTGYSLDIDASKIAELETLLNQALKTDPLRPTAVPADARVVNFPLPGDAIRPHLRQMAEADVLHRYPEVLAEFPEVARAGGAWTSLPPGSQHYWRQALHNVLHGRWQKIDPGYGRAVLGYFGRPPETPDSQVVKLAAEQLKLEPCNGDPLEKATDSLALAEAALRERELPLTEDNLFLVATAIVPGQNLEMNEGLRLLTGQEAIDPPLEILEAPTVEKSPAQPTAPSATLSTSVPAPTVFTTAFTEPVTTQCTVVEGAVTRIFRVTIEPPARRTATDSAPVSSGETVAGASTPTPGE